MSSLHELFRISPTMRKKIEEDISTGFGKSRTTLGDVYNMILARYRREEERRYAILQFGIILGASEAKKEIYGGNNG